jgi:hypothetical protein
MANQCVKSTDDVTFAVKYSPSVKYPTLNVFAYFYFAFRYSVSVLGILALHLF